MAKGFKHGAGGGASLNFKVVGNPQPENPKENTIWIDTDAEITGWHFGAEEPNVYNIETISSDDIYRLRAPHTLKAGEIISFVIPETVTVGLDYVRFHDGGADEYCVRNAGGSSVAAWSAGTKVTVKISNELCTMGEYQCRTALIYGWGSYYHEEGTVWISTGTSSPVEFNALKKNSIQVYPLSAKQYIGGAWVDKVAKSYQNGAWVDLWNGELYEIGKEYTNLTGGWTNIGYSAASGTTINAGSKTDDGIYLAPPTGEVDLAGTDKTIDLTDATTLYCKIDVKKYGGYPNVFCVSKTKVITSPTAIAETKATGVQTLSIDVTTLTGEYYISMRATTGSQVYFQECRFDQK